MSTYEDRLLAGQCTRCKLVLPKDYPYSLCADCTARKKRVQRRYDRRTRARRAIEGRCTYCEQPRLPGFSVCAGHRVQKSTTPREIVDRSAERLARLRELVTDDTTSSSDRDGASKNAGHADVRDLRIAALSLATAAEQLERELDDQAAARAALAVVEVAVLAVEEVLARRGYVRKGAIAPSSPTAPADQPPIGATCAVCGVRPASQWDAVDGKRVPSCASCAADVEVEDPPPPPGLRERILRVLARSDGMSVDEIAEALGEADAPGRNRIGASLARAAHDGQVRHTGGRMSRVYHLVSP